MNNASQRNRRDTFMECKRCKEQVTRNKTDLCRRCRNYILPQYYIGRNNNDGEIRTQDYVNIGQQNVHDNNIINNVLNNPGYIANTKQNQNLRIMAMNPNGFGPENLEKMEMMCQKVIEMNIDLILLSAPDRRWTMKRQEIMKKRFQQIDKNIEIVFSDSGETSKDGKGWLPGGTIAIAIGRIAGMIDQESIRKDKKGRWCAFTLEDNKRTIRIINMYRIPDNTHSGIMTSKAQYDRIEGKIRTAKEYREEILIEVSNEVQEQREKGISEYIIAGDMNQDVTKERIRRFMRETGVEEVHQECNPQFEIPRDATHKKGKTQIDAVFATTAVLNCINECKIVDYNEIIMSDHRGFIFDLNARKYFNMTHSEYDEKSNRLINPNNRKHREKFNQKLKDYITDSKLVEKTFEICNERVTYHEINKLDEEITHALNVATRYAEGNKSSGIITHEKMKKISEMKYLQMAIKKQKGLRIDENAFKRRNEIAQIQIEGKNISQLEEMYGNAVTA